MQKVRHRNYKHYGNRKEISKKAKNIWFFIQIPGITYFISRYKNFKIPGILLVYDQKIFMKPNMK